MKSLRLLRVLCYHSISILEDNSFLSNYGIPPKQFSDQLSILKKAGFRFISVIELLNFLQGKGDLPSRPVLISFDDCYLDFLTVALPILEEKRIPAMVFAVTRRLGMTNVWDKSLINPELRLLDTEGIKELIKRGVIVGSHSQTHPKLTEISSKQLYEEVNGSLNDLKCIGLSGPLLFAYPYGVCDDKVKNSMINAGVQAAFTVKPGLVRFNQDPYFIPHIEIFKEDVGWTFLAKVLLAGRFKLLLKRWQAFLKWLHKLF